ncbi:hypothetical protein [Nocardiopsis composta]|uniref:Uncharacterized protein n=1 Tax=Nocardiopsis composta TaxID=157465 RepID=A0A7W8QJ69_9ACTN|nr:hypothetical protein [Nocardiopsis composta]MBB5431386.1 hypothetical protein [Nocardiopsis composta]
MYATKTATAYEAVNMIGSGARMYLVLKGGTTVAGEVADISAESCTITEIDVISGDISGYAAGAGYRIALADLITVAGGVDGALTFISIA